MNKRRTLYLYVGGNLLTLCFGLWFGKSVAEWLLRTAFEVGQRL